MQKAFQMIVKTRYFLLGLFILLSIASVYAMNYVTINNNLTEYLPDSSETKIGTEILTEEFGSTSVLKVMFENLTEADINTLPTTLSEIEYVSSVSYDNTSTYNVDGYTMFLLTIPYESTSEETQSVITSIESLYSGATLGGAAYIDNQPLIPTYLMVIAFIILLLVLFAFSNSWIEPILFLFTIALAILINMGSNIFLDSVSRTTYSIAALLQLCLSIDYSIILLNRYRQERKLESNKNIAMKNALSHAFPSIFGSSFTTIVGLLCLMFLSFRIGADMGIVLAKGVFISFLTVFFVLPSVILIFDKMIEKTSKPSIHIRVNRMTSFSYKFKKIAPIFLILLFVLGLFLRQQSNIGYVVPATSTDEVSVIFPDDNTMVILYDNQNETDIPELLTSINSDEHILNVSCYYTTIGAPLDASQLADYTGMDETTISMFLMANSISTISIYDFIQLVINNYSSMLTPDQLTQINATYTMLESVKNQFIGSEYSRIILTTNYEKDSDETRAFVVSLNNSMDVIFNEPHYLVGESAMAEELSQTFDHEYLMITFITIAAIFCIVAITFRSFIIPAVLVFIIQTAIFLTSGVLGMVNDNVYFLAILIVQAILMGATIDYGILFTSYFREKIKTNDVKEALMQSYKGSIHTILTSASILILITGLLGIIPGDPTIVQVLRALAVGTISATLLVLFVLPSILVLTRKILFRN